MICVILKLKEATVPRRSHLKKRLVLKSPNGVRVGASEPECHFSWDCSAQLYYKAPGSPFICESSTLIYSLFALFVRASVFIFQKIFSSAQERVQPSINHNFLNQQLLDTRLVFAFTSRERRGICSSRCSVCVRRRASRFSKTSHARHDPPAHPTLPVRPANLICVCIHEFFKPLHSKHTRDLATEAWDGQKNRIIAW